MKGKIAVSSQGRRSAFSGPPSN